MRAAAGTRIHLAGAVLAAALVVLARPGPAAAAPGSAACPPPAPVISAHPDARHVVVLATAAADTVAAGWGDLGPESGVRRPRRWERMPVFGQVARAARVAGPGAQGMLPGPVVLVPWSPGCGGVYRWYRGFAWMRPGVADVVVGRLRRPEDWVGGVPTVDVLRTDMVKESWELPGAARWTVAPETLFDFYATLPTRGQIGGDPWGAVASTRAWVAANPRAAREAPLRYTVDAVYRSAAYASVRAAPSPLAGTYRVEVSRTGGPAHVVYARTELVPRGALFPDDTTAGVFPGAAHGYRLFAAFHRGESRLPSPRPGWLARRWRGIAGAVWEEALEVWLPEVRETDGSRRLRGHLGLWNVDHLLFPDDPELREWISEWSRREFRNMHVANPPGEIVLRPDGGVEITEVMELAPGRAVTLRATRVSDKALHVPVDR